MSIRIVRESSETPNVTNKDDSKMIRYAYGGYDGIVKEYGSQAEATYASGVLRIGSGRIVLQGWEVDIDEFGQEIVLDILEGEYQSIYLELNLSSEIPQIKTLPGIGDYPEVDYGDDLTKSPSGTSRLLLYRVKLDNAMTANITRMCPIIDYAKEIWEEFDRRLRNQGFSRASVQNGEIIIDDKWAEAFYYELPDGTYQEPNGEIVKSGILSVIKNFRCFSYGTKIMDQGTYPTVYGGIVAKIPVRFLPNYSIELSGYIAYWLNTTPLTYKREKIKLILSSDGSLTFNAIKLTTIYYEMRINEEYPIGIFVDEGSNWFIKDPVEE